MFKKTNKYGLHLTIEIKTSKSKSDMLSEIIPIIENITLVDNIDDIGIYDR